MRHRSAGPTADLLSPSACSTVCPRLLVARPSKRKTSSGGIGEDTLSCRPRWVSAGRGRPGSAPGLVFGAGRAAAAPGPVYGEFTLDGSSGGFSGTMTLARGFPAATFASIPSRPQPVPEPPPLFGRYPVCRAVPREPGTRLSEHAASGRQRPRTTSVRRPPRPGGDSSSATSTPAWSPSAGPDQDQDRRGGRGLAGTFNYCSSTLAAPAPDVRGNHRRSAHLGSSHRGLTGNAAAIDTDGASGWFAVQLSSLTLRVHLAGPLPGSLPGRGSRDGRPDRHRRRRIARCFGGNPSSTAPSPGPPPPPDGHFRGIGAAAIPGTCRGSRRVRDTRR